jgi:ankyrin repeat protein
VGIAFSSGAVSLRAAEIVELFLRYGADPARRNGDGKTAADLANERGMFDIAARLTP